MEDINREEMLIKGVSISNGIGIGSPVFLKEVEMDKVPVFPITVAEVDGEIARYRTALELSKEDIEYICGHLIGEGSEDAATIMSTHIEMLKDPLITNHVEDTIRELLINTEAAFYSVVKGYERNFNGNTSPFFEERLLEIKDFSGRVLNNLRSTRRAKLEEQVPVNSILISRDFLPSDIASVEPNHVSGFISQVGGKDSHAALIARAKGIPYVANIPIDSLPTFNNIDLIVVDGLSGSVIINPTLVTREHYFIKQQMFAFIDDPLEKENKASVATFDGYLVDLYANVNSLREVELISGENLREVGLLRSEYFFLHDYTLFLDEEKQYLVYDQIFKRIGKVPITFRIFDLGGEKGIPLFKGGKEDAASTLRGVRYLLYHQDLLRVQLRALLKAAVGYEIRVLLPLVSDISEFREVKQIILEIQKGFDNSHPSIFPIQVGCMVELPSAAFISDILAEESDFLTLGTNDLVQYALGINRNNTASLHVPLHLAILRMIKMVVFEAKKFQKKVTVCGEIASSPLFTPLLIGLGLQSFSCAPYSIPIIEKTIRRLSLLECFELAEYILSLKTFSEIEAHLAKSMSVKEDNESKFRL